MTQMSTRSPAGVEGATESGAEESSKRPPLSRVNPATRLLMVLIMSLPLMLSVDWLSSTVAIVLELALVPLAGLRYRRLLLRMLPVLIFAPFAGLSVLLYSKPQGSVVWEWGLITVSEGSIDLAMAVCVRVLAMVLPIIVLFAGVEATAMADALAQIVRLPSRFVLGALAGLRTLGSFLEDWRQMELARRARGVGDGGRIRRYASMSFVLLVFAVRRGSTLAIAMEARGFGAPAPRTWSRVSRLSRADAVAVAGAVLVMAIAAGVSIAAGTFRIIGV